MAKKRLTRDFAAMAASPAAFRGQIRIDHGGRPRALIAVINDWQLADLEALDDGLLAIAGRVDPNDVILRAYYERPRGHSKTTDLAICCAWLIAFSPRKLTGIAAAADADQARLLVGAVDTLLTINTWLKPLLAVQRNRITNPQTGSELIVQSSDAPSSYGLTPDFVVIDELSHWRSEDLWDSLISSVAKRPSCLCIVISNAGTGLGSSWQWRVREACREDHLWRFTRIDGPVASWITRERLCEQGRLLPVSTYRRLWLNEWLTAQGDALPDADIDFAFGQCCQPVESARPGYVYAAGLDLSLTKDDCVFLVLGKQIGTGRLEMARIWTWRPSVAGTRVDLAEVQATIEKAYRLFGWRFALADWWQGEFLLQRLADKRVPFDRFAFGAGAHDRIARALINEFTQGNLALYPHRQLEAELRATSVVESAQQKLKLVVPRSETTGHGDHVMALGLATLAMEETPSRLVGRPVWGAQTCLPV